MVRPELSPSNEVVITVPRLRNCEPPAELFEYHRRGAETREQRLADVHSGKRWQERQ